MSELQASAEKENDLDGDFISFEKQINSLLSLDIEDERILKQVIHKLIQNIEIFKDRSIKIHFNITNPTAKKGA
jgi:site-specific DNA recombinase